LRLCKPRTAAAAAAAAAAVPEAVLPAAALRAAEAAEAAGNMEAAARCQPPDVGHQVAAARKLLPAAVDWWESTRASEPLLVLIA